MGVTAEDRSIRRPDNHDSEDAVWILCKPLIFSTAWMFFTPTFVEGSVSTVAIRENFLV